MSDFLRPEARAALFRWREALIGAAIAGFGLWLVLTRFGFAVWLGWAVVALGAALIYTGIQRQRFRTGGSGPGVVQVTERRVVYYGPTEGGVVDMDLLSRLDLVPGPPDSPDQPAVWHLWSETGALVEIPVNALGADVLYDAFAALPGIRTEAMLTALHDTPTRTTPTRTVTVWTAGPRRLS